MIKTIIFDFDGVIVESAEIKTKAFAKLFESKGPDIRKKVVEYHLNNAGVSRYEKFKYIYKEILKKPLDEATFKSLCDRFAGCVLEEVIRAPYVEGAIEFLKNNVSQYSFFVISATPQKEIEEICRRRNIVHFFKFIYGAPTSKTSGVKDIISRLCVKPEEVLYVGDALSDYNAARDNTVNFIARVLEGANIFSDVECEKIKNLTYLEEAIGRLNGKKFLKRKRKFGSDKPLRQTEAR